MIISTNDTDNENDTNDENETEDKRSTENENGNDLKSTSNDIKYRSSTYFSMYMYAKPFVKHWKTEDDTWGATRGDLFSKG